MVHPDGKWEWTHPSLPLITIARATAVAAKHWRRQQRAINVSGGYCGVLLLCVIIAILYTLPGLPFAGGSLARSPTWRVSGMPASQPMAEGTQQLSGLHGEWISCPHTQGWPCNPKILRGPREGNFTRELYWDIGFWDKVGGGWVGMWRPILEHNNNKLCMASCSYWSILTRIDWFAEIKVLHNGLIIGYFAESSIESAHLQRSYYNFYFDFVKYIVVRHLLMDT